MESLFQCLGEEFKDVEFTSMNISPSHGVTYTKNGMVENIITLTVTVYSNIHKIVGKKIIKFVNDKYKITPAKKLDHITPEQLDSTFLLAKQPILEEIYQDYITKYNTIAEKLEKLQKYSLPNE